MSTIAPSSHPSSAVPKPRTRLRLLAVAGGALAPVAVWLLAEGVFGISVRQPSFGASPPQALNPGLVAAVGALAGLLGWGSLSLFERVSAHAAWRWFLAASAGLLLSLGGPLSGHGVSVPNRLVLLCMHLTVGVAVIASLLKSSPTPGGRAANGRRS